MVQNFLKLYSFYREINVYVISYIVYLFLYLRYKESVRYFTQQKLKNKVLNKNLIVNFFICCKKKGFLEDICFKIIELNHEWKIIQHFRQIVSPTHESIFKAPSKHHNGRTNVYSFLSFVEDDK